MHFYICHSNMKTYNNNKKERGVGEEGEKRDIKCKKQHNPGVNMKVQREGNSEIASQNVSSQCSTKINSVKTDVGQGI